MGEILSIVAPLFGLVALGYAAVRLGYLSRVTADGVNSFVLAVAVPALLFRTVSTARIGEASPLLLWLVYFAAVLAVGATAFALARRFGRLDRRHAVIAAVAAAYANIVLVSLPVIDRLYGRAGLDVFALLVAVHLPVMLTASMFLMEWAAAADRREELNGANVRAGYRAAAGRVAKALSRHPLMIAVAAGLVFRLSGLVPPRAASDVVDMIARTAGPLALVALGMSLPRYRIGAEVALPLALGLLALAVQPLLVLLLGSLVLPPLWLHVAVICAAAPSGINAYLLALHFRTGEAIAATLTVATTFASILTVTLWVAILGR